MNSKCFLIVLLVACAAFAGGFAAAGAARLPPVPPISLFDVIDDTFVAIALSGPLHDASGSGTRVLSMATYAGDRHDRTSSSISPVALDATHFAGIRHDPGFFLRVMPRTGLTWGDVDQPTDLLISTQHP